MAQVPDGSPPYEQNMDPRIPLHCSSTANVWDLSTDRGMKRFFGSMRKEAFKYMQNLDFDGAMLLQHVVYRWWRRQLGR
jgi:hypothetical protein